MAVAWPIDMQADDQLLDNVMEYLESEAINNEGEFEIITIAGSQSVVNN